VGQHGRKETFIVSFKRRVLVWTGASLTIIALSAVSLTSVSAAEGGARRIKILDDCDPKTFNAALNDPKACVGRGDTTFQEFIAELTANKTVEDWAFDPEHRDVKRGQTVIGQNRGGETHTFTCVKQFGRGIVPFLNNLMGFAAGPPTDVCTGEVLADSFIPSGGSRSVSLSRFTVPNGTYRFQCMIHPWMRTVLEVERK
jgi:plastocyanin